MDTTSQGGDAPVPRSRREMREAAEARTGRTPRRRSPGQTRKGGRGAHAAPAGHTWVTRVTVLGSLAAATIAVPLTGTADADDGSPFDLESRPTGPSTLALLESGADTPGTAAAIAAAPRERSVAAASRSSDRNPLPDCDMDAPVDGGNGQLADHSLCDLWQSGEQLRPDAAVSLSALNEAFRARFGRDLCLVDSYRSLSSQYSVKASRGFLAATPGTSMHGWGLAIDLCSKETGSAEVYKWLWDNAPAFGWENPPWAQRGGSGKYEPWHFEYRAGVEEVSTWH